MPPDQDAERLLIPNVGIRNSLDLDHGKDEDAERLLIPNAVGSEALQLTSRPYNRKEPNDADTTGGSEVIMPRGSMPHAARAAAQCHTTVALRPRASAHGSCGRAGAPELTVYQLIGQVNC